MAKPTVLVTYGSWVEQVVAMVARAGARATIIEAGDNWRANYQCAQGIIFTGGPDISPSEYRQAWHHAQPGNAYRDGLELPLARRALHDGKAVFGICRGLQVLMVASGGTLHQDIEADTGVAHPRGSDHGVRVWPHSRLAGAVGHVVTYRVNSYHHQSVKRVPKNWRIVAESSDGVVVEAVEWQRGNGIAVQWHPEVLDDEASARLIAAWVKSVKNW